jgi:triacylglycerol lipase
MLPKKPLPVASLQNVLPPNRDYHYFENAGTLPFRPISDRLEMANAWWLAEASLLAYAEEPFVREQYRRAGIRDVKAFEGASTRCYVAWNDTIAITAFRGTRVFKPGEKVDWRGILRDLEVDARFTLTAFGATGSVHQGFKAALDQIWDGPSDNQKLRAHLDWLRKSKSGRTIWFTGHSLGAALATLAAVQYNQGNGLYTFGSPRVGDQNFSHAVARTNLNSYRFVNNNDIVTRIPTQGAYAHTAALGLYQHVGLLQYIDAAGIIRTSPGFAERLRDSVEGYWLRLKSTLGNMTAGLQTMPDDNFVDHAPIYYGVHIWNFA